jgi:hypothetical protein
MGTVLNWGNPLHKPYSLFFLGFGVITIYIPGIIGASISTGWLFLLIVAPILFCYCDKTQFGFGFAFICYAVISIAWTEILNIAWFHLLQLIVLACIFYIGQNIKDDGLKIIFKGLSIGLGVSACLAIAQKFGFTQVYTLANSTAGLFINPNIYSEISAIILVSLIVLKLWWWIPVTLPGLFLVQSRSAFVALGFGLFILAWRYNKYLAIISIIVVGTTGSYFYWHRFDLISVQERLNMWADTIQGFKFFGNGVGSYEALFPYYASHINTELARPRYAHNDLLQVVFEFGIGSILLLMVLFNVFKTKRPELIILFTVGVISLFTYPIHIPTSAFIAFLVAGFVTRNNGSDGDIWIDRGPNLFKGNTTKQFAKA